MLVMTCGVYPGPLGGFSLVIVTVPVSPFNGANGKAVFWGEILAKSIPFVDPRRSMLQTSGRVHHYFWGAMAGAFSTSAFSSTKASPIIIL